MEIPKEKLLEMYRNLVTARQIDEKFYELSTMGGTGMPSLHRATGEEAIPIAVIANLRKDDYVKPSFRTQFCVFAKGVSLRDVIASECERDLEKVGGNTKNVAFDYGLIGRSGSLGEEVCIYTGAALSAKLRKTDQVCVCTFGDGTASRGPVHEAMVVAAAWELPIVFILQNNQYGMGTSSRREVYKMEDISDRAKGYGFPGQTVDGNDIIAVYEVVKEYVERARSGGGPGLIVAETYRLGGHYIGDPQIYRPKGEAEEWWKKDPLPRYQKRLMEMGILTDEDIKRIDAEAKAEVDEAAKAALAVPHPTYEDYIKGGVVDVL